VKLSLVISTLTCGGAERVMSLLANEWVHRGHRVQLVTLDRERPFFPLDPRVELTQLDCEKSSPTPFHALWNLNRSVAALRQAQRAFGAEGVISFTTRVNVKALMAARPLGIPVVVSERVDPRMDGEGSRWTRLRDHWYPRAHRVVLQTETVKEYFLSLGPDRLRVIPNPVEPVSTVPRVEERLGAEFTVLNIARLVPQKGHDLLLQALARTRHPVRLKVLGDGPDRPALLDMARSLGVADRVDFLGFVAEKDQYWREAGAFVLSSRYEGYPNALCEAMVAGLPSVAFDCPSGPSDLIVDGVNGLLVPAENVDALASALDRLADDPALRQRLGREGSKITETLGLPGITDRWEEALRP